MPSIYTFKLFTESMQPAAPTGDVTLEMTNRLFPLLGDKFQRSVDPDVIFEGDEDTEGDFDLDLYQERLKEVVNKCFKKLGIEEHLVSLGVGIKSLNYQELGGKHVNELYYDLVMEEDWQETVAEHIQSIRPATLDKHLQELYKHSAGFISKMPKTKRDLLAAITDEDDDDRERGIGAFLYYLVGSDQVEEWGADVYSTVRDELWAGEFFTPEEVDEDDE